MCLLAIGRSEYDSQRDQNTKQTPQLLDISNKNNKKKYKNKNYIFYLFERRFIFIAYILLI